MVSRAVRRVVKPHGGVAATVMMMACGLALALALAALQVCAQQTVDPDQIIDSGGGGDDDYDIGFDYFLYHSETDYGITPQQGKDAGTGMAVLVGMAVGVGVVANAVVPPQPQPPVSAGFDIMTLLQYAQYIVTLGLLSGHQPGFVRLFAGQFAWLFPLGSSSGLRSIANGIRSGTSYALDKGPQLADLTPLEIITQTGMGQLCAAAGIESENAFIALFFLLLFLHAGALLGAVIVLYALPGAVAKLNPTGPFERVVKLFADLKVVRWRLLALQLKFFWWFWPALTVTSLYQMWLHDDYAALLVLAYLSFFVVVVAVPVWLHVRAVQAAGGSLPVQLQGVVKPLDDPARGKAVYVDLFDDFKPDRAWFGGLEHAELFLNALWLGTLQAHADAQIAMVFLTHVSLTAGYWLLDPHKERIQGLTTKIIRTGQSLLLLFSTGFVTLKGDGANALGGFVFVVHILVLITALLFNAHQTYGKVAEWWKERQAKKNGTAPAATTAPAAAPAPAANGEANAANGNGNANGTAPDGSAPNGSVAPAPAGANGTAVAPEPLATDANVQFGGSAPDASSQPVAAPPQPSSLQQPQPSADPQLFTPSPAPAPDATVTAGAGTAPLPGVAPSS